MPSASKRWKNRTLKRLPAEQMLYKETFKEMLAKRSNADVEERRRDLGDQRETIQPAQCPCGLAGISPKTYRSQAQRSQDGGLRKRMREVASERRRFVYRRIALMLEREGIC